MRLRLFVIMSLSSLIMLNAVVLKAEELQWAPSITMTNDPAGNSVLVFDRFEDGTLIPAGTFLTGELGTGRARFRVRVTLAPSL